MATTLPETKVLIPHEPELTDLSDRLTSLLNRLQPPPEILCFIAAGIIGGGVGIVMAIFHYLIQLIEYLTLDSLMGKISGWGTWTLATIPLMGGMVVGLIRWLYKDFFGDDLHSLISNRRIQRISPLRPAIKMLAASVSLGTGASLGPEGPTVEIGATLGAILGQLFHVSKERYRLLLGAGAAAALAAGFNAPMAGVFFALEVVIGVSFSTSAASLVLLSAFVSSLISRCAFGSHPAFALPAYKVASHWEWIFYLGLGVIASVVSIAYTQGIKIARDWFQGKIPGMVNLVWIPRALHPALGGASVGLVALQVPQILGVGYSTIEAILHDGRFPISVLCLLLVAKIAMTAISLGSGLVGGVFAPAMFIGATLGAIYGNVLELIIPSGWIEIAPPAAYAMVGMAAVLAGSVKAPMTALLLLFEMTQNYEIILPLMVAVGASVWLVEQFNARKSVQGLNLQEMGINMQKQNDMDVLSAVSIAQVMHQSYLTLSAEMPVLEAGLTMLHSKCHTALVLDACEQLEGIITLDDIRRHVFQPENHDSHQACPIYKLRDICTAEIIYASVDEPVTKALERMAVRGLTQLPVVAPDNDRRVVGMLERERIALACNLAVFQSRFQDSLN
ncbi:MAG TPA: chloride channel protein [Oscillatoriaceae cyanobacterium M33_DOE_052]|uniref:Chloride channel protein n=1 Tax=Planktothricoides sp. SpSt-374 TaxID=2282167 RepID=A0A7C3ZK86_9CYAN|nr:chloride channel protein [Oscillatoriaceae cyanobacterium M33_DOE_052]